MRTRTLIPALCAAMALGASSAGAIDYTVHAAKIVEKASLTPQAEGEKIQKLTLNNRRLANFLLGNPDLNAPIPKNLLLVLLVPCPLTEFEVKLAVWDRDAETLSMALEPIPLQIDAAAIQTRGPALDKVDLHVSVFDPGEGTESDGDESLITATGTAFFKPLGRKFPGDEETVCASKFKGASLSGYFLLPDDVNLVLMKGKLTAGKVLAIYEE